MLEVKYLSRSLSCKHIGIADCDCGQPWQRYSCSRCGIAQKMYGKLKQCEICPQIQNLRTQQQGLFKTIQIKTQKMIHDGQCSEPEELTETEHEIEQIKVPAHIEVILNHTITVADEDHCCCGATKKVTVLESE